MISLKSRFGFTLIELMMVSAIIGLLAAIAIPKFANMVIKAKEANVIATLGLYRSAISLYYADTEGIFPHLRIPFFGAGVYPKFLKARPEISIPTVPTHVRNGSVADYLEINMNADWLAGLSWNYNRFNGHIVVHCTHMDTKGRVWTTY